MTNAAPLNKQAEDMTFFWNKKTLVTYCLSIFVFWIHISSFTNYAPLPSTIYWISFCFQEMISRVAVPLFMIISGALFYRDYDNTKYWKKLKQRASSLMVPYLLWNTINMVFHILTTLFLSSYFSGRQPFVFSLSNILKGVFYFQYNGPFWFLFALIIFTLSAPLIDWMLSKKVGGAAAILAVWGLSLFDIEPPWPLSNLILYLVGAFIGRYYFSEFSKKRSLRECLPCLAMIALFMASRVVDSYNCFSWGHIIETPLLIFASLSTWVLFDAVCCVIKTRPFMQRSFWVFALHENIGAIIAKLFYFALPKNPAFSLLNFAGTTILSLAVIEGICRVIKHLLPSFYRLLSGGR